MQFFITFERIKTGDQVTDLYSPKVFSGPFRTSREALDYVTYLEQLKKARFSDRQLKDLKPGIDYRYQVFSDHEKNFSQTLSNFFHDYVSKVFYIYEMMKGVKFDPYLIMTKGDGRSFDYQEVFRHTLLMRKYGHIMNQVHDIRKDKTSFTALLKQYEVPEFGLPL